MRKKSFAKVSAGVLCVRACLCLRKCLTMSTIFITSFNSSQVRSKNSSSDFFVHFLLYVFLFLMLIKVLYLFSDDDKKNRKECVNEIDSFQ